MARPKGSKNKVPRKRSVNTVNPTGRKHCDNEGVARVMKAKWADPVWKAAQLEKLKAGREKAKQENPERFHRRNVPDGMRKAQALVKWAEADEQAGKFIKLMEAHDKVEKVPAAGSEEEMAKNALREAYKMAVSPLTDAKVKATYQRLVLDFTRAKPESKTKLTLDKSEEWLAALEADMKLIEPPAKRDEAD